MRNRSKSVLFLDAIHNHQSLIARGAPRAISDRAIVGSGLHQGGNGFLQQGAIPFFGFGREKFERDNGVSSVAPGCVDVANKLHK